MTRFQQLTLSIDDRLNPVVVKELRQAVNARFISGVIYVFLALLVLTLGLFLLNIQPTQQVEATDSGGLGALLSMLAILVFASMICIPGFVAARIIAETGSNEFELMFSTQLTPAAVVRGKLFSGIVLIVLLYSITTPFLTFTYLLRGIDVVTVLFIVTATFFAVLPVLQLAILVAILPIKRVFKLVLMVGTMLVLFYVALTSLFIIPSMVRYGGGFGVQPEFWVVAIVIVAISIGLVVVLYSWSAAAVAPLASNRALPVRLTMTIIWLVAGIALGSAALARGEVWMLRTWLYTSVILFSLCMFAAVSERDTVGIRVARSIPNSSLRRFSAFPFFSGSLNGLIWAAILIVMTIGTYLSLEQSGVFPYVRNSEHGEVAIAMALHGICFALGAFGLQRGFLGRWLRQGQTWAMGFFLVAIGAVVSAVFEIMVFAGVEQRTEITLWRIANPFSVGDDLVRVAVFHFGIAVLLVELLMLRKRLWRQVKLFRPPDLPQVTSEDDT